MVVNVICFVHFVVVSIFKYVFLEVLILGVRFVVLIDVGIILLICNFC